MPDFVLTFKIVITVIVTTVFLVLLILEGRFSLRQGKHSKVERFLINIAVSGLALATGAYIVAPVALRLASWNSENSFGLLRVISLPFTIEFILGFLLMDLTFYYWHRANHSVPFFWRFHNVHHVDPDLDVSTSFRFHFGEVFYSLGFRSFQVYLIGIPLFTYLVYEMVFQCATIFHHSNVRLPITVERWLNTVVVTPRMHGIHYSIVKGETNSNFSVVFRWWDLMHGTLMLNVSNPMSLSAFQLTLGRKIINCRLFLSSLSANKGNTGTCRAGNNRKRAYQRAVKIFSRHDSEQISSTYGGN